MFPYNVVETQGEKLIARCAERNIGFIDMKPLAGGAIDDAAVAMRFIAANPNVTVVIPGMERIEQIRQNADAVNNTAALSNEEKNKIAAIRKELGTNFCRRCNYCAPCTEGINIPFAIMLEGYYTRYGLQEWATGRYNTMTKKASDCVGCGVCESRCPYNLPIRQMLKRVEKVFGE
jgi:predicted aldo/keto reductase-like oxidoreductase